MAKLFQRMNFSRGKRRRLAEIEVENGTRFYMCNFSQSKPNTEILAGYTGLIFEQCNCRNCKMPSDATFIKSPNSQWDLCKNKYPYNDELDDCTENCKHVVETHEVKVDGKTISTSYTYDKIRI